MPSHVFLGAFLMLGWMYWILVGLIAGWLTGKITRGAGFGCLGNVLLGLVGAFLGGWILSRLGVVFLGPFGAIAAATLGAVLLVSLATLFAGRRP